MALARAACSAHGSGPTRVGEEVPRGCRSLVRNEDVAARAGEVAEGAGRHRGGRRGRGAAGRVDQGKAGRMLL